MAEMAATSYSRYGDSKKTELMFIIIGIVCVFGAVVGGYLMEKGNLLVLLQPAELVIIGGAAIGTVLISNPPRILTNIIKGALGVLKGSRYTKDWYLQTLKMMYDLFDKTRRQGLSQIEAEIEDPDKSPTFANFPTIVKDHHIIEFVCDTFRTIMVGGVEPFDLDQMMESDMDVHHHAAMQPVTALSNVADALPGLGIVAAVLGVVITMGALGGPPNEIGHKVAAALVGTFLGILLCYGLVGPLASAMTKEAEQEHEYYGVLRICLTSFNKGIAPIIAVEIARRAVPGHVRPTFQEMESLCRNKPAAAQPMEAAA